MQIRQTNQEFNFDKMIPQKIHNKIIKKLDSAIMKI